MLQLHETSELAQHRMTQHCTDVHHTGTRLYTPRHIRELDDCDVIIGRLEQGPYILSAVHLGHMAGIEDQPKVWMIDLRYKLARVTRPLKQHVGKCDHRLDRNGKTGAGRHVENVVKIVDCARPLSDWREILLARQQGDQVL